MNKVKQKKSYLPSAAGVRKGRKDYYDFNLLAVIVLLTCFGLIMLYSTSAYMAQVKYGDDMTFFKKQALISVACIGVAIVISMIDYHILTYFTTLLYGAAMVLMALVQTPLGITVNGAKRWLGITENLSFQPSEIAKIAAIVCLSYMIVKMGKRVRTLKACMVLLGMGGALALATYVFTENLSTAIIIFCITIGLIFVAHPEMRPFLIVLAVGLVVIAAGVIFLTSTLETSDNFRIRRILVWLHPEDYASGDGYQTLQALYAIGSGGLFGRGLGNSIQKLGSVPEAQNDMIFSIICEELGIFGGMLVLILFGYLLYRLFFIAQNAPDMFGSLLVSGVFIHVALQVILNISVVLNLLPNTGVTLPFISYGGTSILFLMSEMGLALSVARRIKFQQPESIW
jgi:cell division protein FtsW